MANDALTMADTPTAVAPTRGRGNPLMYTLGMPIAMFGLFIALLPPVLVAMALKVAEIAPQNQAGRARHRARHRRVRGDGRQPPGRSPERPDRREARHASSVDHRWHVVGFAAPSWPSRRRPSVVVLVVAWGVAQIAYNATIAALTAVMPDHVTRSQRGRVAALLGLAQNLALVGGTFLVQLFSTSATQMIVPGAIGSASSSSTPCCSATACS